MTPDPPSSTPITWEAVGALLNSKFVSAGIPGAITAVAVSQGLNGDWINAARTLGFAALAWVLIDLFRRLAPEIDRFFDWLYDTIFVGLTGFRGKYLDALKADCYQFNVEGAGGYIDSLVLDEVYVPLRVTPGIQQQSDEYISSGELRIWDFLLSQSSKRSGSNRYRLLAIVAGPGYGKTTLMRFLTLNFCSSLYKRHTCKSLIPILLLLRKIHTQIQSETEPKLPELIAKELSGLPRFSDLHTSENWFRERLKQGTCLVMLDGLDEVPPEKRELVSRWANWQMQHYYTTQFIVTSRPHGYDGNLFSNVQQLDILNFNTRQQSVFINQWYQFTYSQECQLEYERRRRQRNSRSARPRLKQMQEQANRKALNRSDELKRRLFADLNLIKLAGNPLLLTIIVATYNAYGNLSKERVLIYKRIFRLLLEDRPRLRSTQLALPEAENTQDVLQKIAINLIEKGHTQFTPDEGAEWISEQLSSYISPSELSPKKFLWSVEKITGLLYGAEGNLYEFTHKTFQEYLAALELSNMADVGSQRVLSQIDNEDWKEVVYFFAMIEEDPVPFIEAALKNSKVNSLTLAQRLVQDNTKVKEDLKDKVLDALRKHNFAFSAVQLQQHFRDLVQINNKVGISGFITWGEYNLFQQDQLDGQFHSQAALYSTYSLPNGNPIEDISQEDARWFCAWLSTQTSMVSEDEVYDYRLPTPEEWQQAQQHIAASEHSRPLTPWTTDPALGGNTLCVVRECIPDRYKNLVNYLANGAWKEADQEINRQMLKAVGSDAEKRGYLELEEIREFPCDELRIIDRLWVKFSGGRFGFSVQKQIWVEVGGKLDYGKDSKAAVKAFELVSDRNGWRQSGSYISYLDVTFDTSAPIGHLPIVWWLVGDGEVSVSSLASRLVRCSI